MGNKENEPIATPNPSSVPDTRRKIEDGWWWVRRHGRPNPQPCKVTTTNAQYVELDGEKFYSDQFHNLDFIRRIPSPSEMDALEKLIQVMNDNGDIRLDPYGEHTTIIELLKARNGRELIESALASLTSPQAEGSRK